MNINVMHLYLVMLELLGVVLVGMVMFGIYLLVRYVIYLCVIVFVCLFCCYWFWGMRACLTVGLVSGDQY